MIRQHRMQAGDDVGPTVGRGGGVRVLAYVLMSLVLWIPAVVLLGAFVLALLRGLLYGLVVDGPYTNAWGGPTLAGAWAMHALAALPLLTTIALGVIGLAALHAGVSRRLIGTGGSGWTVVVAALVGAAGLLVVIAWSRQI